MGQIDSRQRNLLRSSRFSFSSIVLAILKYNPVPSIRPLKPNDPAAATLPASAQSRSEEHTSELQSRLHLVCRLLLEKKNTHNDILTERAAHMTLLPR